MALPTDYQDATTPTGALTEMSANHATRGLNRITEAVNANTTKLAGIATGADVTNATSVDAAGAVMNSDTSTAAMQFVVGENNLASNSATKVPTQQSVKAYVDGTSGGSLPSQTGNSGKYLTTNGTTASWGAVSTTGWAEIDITKSPYNGDNTGVNDIAAVLLTAVNNTQGKASIFLPPGTYKWTSSLSSGYPVHIRGAGIGITNIMVDADHGMLITGSTGSNYTLSGNITAGDTSFTVSSSSGLAVGDILNIRSLKIWEPSAAAPNGSGKEGKYGELVQVYGINGNTVTTTGLIAYSYATADTVTITKQNMVYGGSFRSCTVQNSAPNTGGADFITLRRMRNFILRDVEFRYLDGAGIYGTLAWGVSADNVTFHDGSEQSSQGRLAYGLAMYEASRDWFMTNCIQIGGRHMFTTGAYGAGGVTSYGVPRGAVIANCLAGDSYEVPFDTHDEADEISFVNCKVISSRGFAFQLRGPRSKLIGCSAARMNVAAMVRPWAYDFEIVNFTAVDIVQGGAGNSAAVQVESGGTGTPSGVIDGVHAVRTGHAAVLVQTGVGPLTIRNITADDYCMTNGNGAVEFVGTSSGHVIQNVVARNGSDPAIYGPGTVTAVTADGIQVRDGVAYTGGGIGITLTAKTDVPANATAAGEPGMWAADSSALYICTAHNVWRKVTIASW